MVGCTTCRMHGAKAPQVQQAARDRLAALVHPAVSVLAAILHESNVEAEGPRGGTIILGPTPADRLKAVEAILDRTGYPRRTGIDVDAGLAELQAVLDELDGEGGTR